MRRVLVLNQFALPRSEAGGTRHVDVFERVPDWTFRIVAGHLNHYSQKPVVTSDDRFVLVRIPAYDRAGARRMVGWGVYAVQAVVQGVRGGRPDVVYASSPHLLAPLAGAVLSTVWRCPLVVEIRDLWPETLVAAGALRRGARIHRALVALERWIYRRADHLVAVTSGWEAHFGSFEVHADKITVVPNGTEVPTRPEIAREDLRLRHRIHGTTAVYAGAHGPANALDSVLDAARQLPEMRFLLIGAGSEKERLQVRAGAEGLGNVEFRDPMPKDDLMELLGACDIGVHSIEPLSVLQLGMSPNKLFDYMATGLPVVSNAGQGLARVIDDETCGLIGEPDSLAASLRQLLEEGPERRAARGRAGRDLVRMRFSRTAAAGQLAEVLTHVSR